MGHLQGGLSSIFVERSRPGLVRGESRYRTGFRTVIWLAPFKFFLKGHLRVFRKGHCSRRVVRPAVAGTNPSGLKRPSTFNPNPYTLNCESQTLALDIRTPNPENLNLSTHTSPRTPYPQPLTPPQTTPTHHHSGLCPTTQIPEPFTLQPFPLDSKLRIPNP